MFVVVCSSLFFFFFYFVTCICIYLFLSFLYTILIFLFVFLLFCYLNHRVLFTYDCLPFYLSFPNSNPLALVWLVWKGVKKNLIINFPFWFLLLKMNNWTKDRNYFWPNKNLENCMIPLLRENYHQWIFCITVEWNMLICPRNSQKRRR